MRAKSLALLGVVTIIAAGGAILLPDNAGQLAPPAPPPSEPVLPGLAGWIGHANDLVLRTSAASVELTRQSSPAGKPVAPWLVAEKDGYPADPAKVGDLLRHLSGLVTVAPRTADPKLYRRLDVGGPGAVDHGTDPQSTLVTLTDAGGHAASLILGKTHSDMISGSDDGIYVRRPDAALSWLARPAVTVSALPFDWIDTTLIDLDPATLDSITLKPAVVGAPSVTFSRPAGPAAGSAPWEIDGLPADAKLKPGDPGSDLAGALHPLHFTDVEKTARITGDPDGEVIVKSKDGLVVHLLLFKRAGIWVKLRADGSGPGAARANTLIDRSTVWAYKIDDDTAKQLSQTAADLVQPPTPPVAPAPAVPGPAP